MSRDPVLIYGPRKVAWGGRGFDESITGFIFDDLDAMKKGNANPAAAKTTRPAATMTFRFRDIKVAEVKKSNLQRNKKIPKQ